MKILLFFLLSINVCTVFAQGLDGKVILGLNVAQVDGDFIWGYNKPGINTGLAGTLKLAKKMKFQLEILYSIKGAGSTISQPFLKSSFDYIDFPLTIMYEAQKKWHLQFGMCINYLLSAKYDMSGFGYNDVKYVMHTFDFAYLAGIEYKLAEEWAINARWLYSAIPINNYNLLFTRGLYHNYLTFSIRYTFIKSTH
ncbi:MAG: porin family protein [Cytophagales bacterium]|nr:porin family protein [Cytophagales bacterium]